VPCQSQADGDHGDDFCCVTLQPAYGSPCGESPARQAGPTLDSPGGESPTAVGPFCRKGLRGSPRPATIQVAMSKSGGRRSRRRFLLRDIATRIRFALRRKSRSASGTYFDSPGGESPTAVGPFCRKGLRGSPRPATVQGAMSKSGGRRSRRRFVAARHCNPHTVRLAAVTKNPARQAGPTLIRLRPPASRIAAQRVGWRPEWSVDTA